MRVRPVQDTPYVDVNVSASSEYECARQVMS